MGINFKRQYESTGNVFFFMRKGFLIVFLLISLPVFCQKEKPQNYRRFDERVLHFGFMLGVNTSNFTVYPVLNAFEQYGLKSLVAKAQPGGQVGIVSTLKLGTPVVRLRFLPSLSFQERALLYTFQNPDTNATTDVFIEQRINSTNLNFPLMFQFRTLRLNNFASYVLVGGEYVMDLQSQENASQDFLDPFIKVKKHDFHGQVGAGVEFFAPYFKFGIEIKYAHSFYNSFIQDLTPISKPISRLYNQVWWISLVFEG